MDNQQETEIENRRIIAEVMAMCIDKNINFSVHPSISLISFFNGQDNPIRSYYAGSLCNYEKTDRVTLANAFKIIQSHGKKY